ncbi:MAG: hypothetical protein ONB44_22940 [candidate division KSB1 bacterium]|nr:hypothetical protein [candidate division KSB1 bacterium]MDZ7314039.1 hypothetical protein [candidate division KSB1 bacterium]
MARTCAAPSVDTKEWKNNFLLSPPRVEVTPTVPGIVVAAVLAGFLEDGKYPAGCWQQWF